jgi:uncharacterized LabA/DUF88 family protein
MAAFERACIFVDGENLRFSLLELFPTQFRKEDYLPDANWGGFFDSLVSRAGSKTRVRAYWYVIQHIDFWPWSYPQDQASLIPILCKHEPYRLELTKLTGPPQQTRALELRKRLMDYRHTMLERFRGWTAVQDGISGRADAVEFRRAGAIKCDLFTGEFGKEKAVDVKLAVDLLELRPAYDVAVIVSGDQDYVPAVQAIKDSGKRVLNACFLKQNGELLPGGARRLNQITDSVIRFPYEELREFMRFAPLSAALPAPATPPVTESN